MTSTKQKFLILDSDTKQYTPVVAVDEGQMREIDRMAVEDYGLGILQMMENAGRNLALTAIEMLQKTNLERILVAAGSGGNGGGGVCAARHLHNHGVPVSIVPTRPPEKARGALRVQLQIISQMPIPILLPTDSLLPEFLILDALIGYSLQGPPSDRAAELIERVNASGSPVLSLDLPSGVDASTGKTPGVFVQANRTLSLALPKQGLSNPACGDLFLADIGIPDTLYRSMRLSPLPEWGQEYRLPLRLAESP